MTLEVICHLCTIFFFLFNLPLFDFSLFMFCVLIGVGMMEWCSIDWGMLSKFQLLCLLLFRFFWRFSSLPFFVFFPFFFSLPFFFFFCSIVSYILLRYKFYFSLSPSLFLLLLPFCFLWSMHGGKHCVQSTMAEGVNLIVLLFRLLSEQHYKVLSPFLLSIAWQIWDLKIFYLCVAYLMKIIYNLLKCLN